MPQISRRLHPFLDRLILAAGELLIAFGTKLKYHVNSQTVDTGSMENMGAKI